MLRSGLFTLTWSESQLKKVYQLRDSPDMRTSYVTLGVKSGSKNLKNYF